MPIESNTPVPVPLFGGQIFYGQNFPIYAWKLWTAPNTMVRSQDRPDKGASFSFLAANASIFAVLWYHLYPYKDWYYGSAKTGSLILPDGTSRPWATGMSQTAFDNLLAKLFEEENLWPSGLNAPSG